MCCITRHYTYSSQVHSYMSVCNNENVQTKAGIDRGQWVNIGMKYTSTFGTDCRMMFVIYELIGSANTACML